MQKNIDMMLQEILCVLAISKDSVALNVLIHVLTVLEGTKMVTFGTQKV
jgi:hypothetical protein